MVSIHHVYGYDSYYFKFTSWKGSVLTINKLILYPLLILLLASAFSQLINLGGGVNFSYNQTLEQQATEGNQTLNEAESHLQQQTENSIFDINMSMGLIALIIGLVVVGVVAGIQVLGSGLSPFSVQLIYKSTTYYGLWGVFSALSFTLFSSVPSFGLLIWFFLTFIYSIGFFQTLQVTSD